MPIKRPGLYFAGWGIPLIFWTTTILCAFILGGYHHLERMVSELGAQGARTQSLFTAGLLTCAVLSVPFFLGLCRACREAGLSAAPVLILFPAYSFSIAGAAIFPMPLRLHALLGGPSVLLFLSPLLALLMWPGRKQPAWLRPMTWAVLALLTISFLAFLPDVWASARGLKQRFAHLGWSIWFASLGTAFGRIVKVRPKDG